MPNCLTAERPIRLRLVLIQGQRLRKRDAYLRSRREEARSFEICNSTARTKPGVCTFMHLRISRGG